jgi:D,D-heptose 1,7-bisphosphate phosphatase
VGIRTDRQAGRITRDCSERRHPAVFLDRDGTLNVETGGVRREEALQVLPGVGAALRRLRQEGYRLVVLTNQSVIARGQADEADVAAVHRRLERELGREGAYLDGIYVCPHHPEYGSPGERAEFARACQCRKPATGLLERACAELGLDRSRSWVVGDQTRDIEMARRAGVRSILVMTGRGGADGEFHATPDFVASNLTAAADVILRHRDAVSV